MTGRNARATLLPGGAAFAALALSLLLFWPGVALYDSVRQYREALSGVYEDWHPPIMARLWSLLIPVAPATWPMFVLQLGLIWLGLGLLAAALTRRGHPWAGCAVLGAGVAAFPSCWMGAVLKDGQMVGALAAAAGIVGWFRLGERRLPAWAMALVLILLAYAALVRANAVFAVVPLGFVLFGRPRSASLRGAAALAVVALLILLTPPINHRLLGARHSGVENSLLIYDIGGTAIRAEAGDVAGVPSRRWAELAAKDCYSPNLWDRFGAPECRADPRLQIRNCGIYGQRTDEIAARLDECARDADVLIVQGGINDIAQGRDVEAAATNLRAMVRRGTELGLRVALADVLPWNNGWPDAEPKIRRLNELVAQIAHDEDVPLLRFHETLEDPDRPGRMRDEWTFEGDHPNEDGYRRLAHVVLRALQNT